MAKEEKEGESYLDQLLNTVAPDWEDTSRQPEKAIEKIKKEEVEEVADNTMSEAEDISVDDISLDEALSLLNDLPDTDEISADGENTDEDIDELFDLLSELDDGTVSQAGTDEPDIPAAVQLPEEISEPEMEEKIKEEPEEPSEEPVYEENTAAEEEVPLVLEDIMPEEPQGDELSISEEPVAVDDIFQDALSAVAYSENEEQQEDLFSLDQMAEFVDDSEDGITQIPAADPVSGADGQGKKRKSGGFFKNIFGNIITEQTAEEEEKERLAEREAQAKKAAEKEEKKKQAAISKEEKAQLSQEEKERKKQLKAEQAAKKAEKKAEKKRIKAEQDAEAAKEVVGKINPVGATIVIIFFVTIGVFTIFGSKLLSRSSSLSQAENYFANGQFLQAYDAISNVNLKEDDEVLYRRIRICSQMQKEVGSYTNYTTLGMKLEALDSLVKGIGYYDLNRAEAESLGVLGELNSLESQIAASLYNDFGISETQAREILSLQDQGEYTRRLQEIVSRIQVVEQQ